MSDKEVPALRTKKEVSLMLSYAFLEEVLDLDVEILRDRLDALAYRGHKIEGIRFDDDREAIILTGPDVSSEV